MIWTKDGDDPGGEGEEGLCDRECGGVDVGVGYGEGCFALLDGGRRAGGARELEGEHVRGMIVGGGVGVGGG